MPRISKSITILTYSPAVILLLVVFPGHVVIFHIGFYLFLLRPFSLRFLPLHSETSNPTFLFQCPIISASLYLTR